MAKHKPNAVSVSVTGAGATGGAGSVRVGGVTIWGEVDAGEVLFGVLDLATGDDPEALVKVKRRLARRNRARAATHARGGRPKTSPERHGVMVEVIRQRWRETGVKPVSTKDGAEIYRELSKGELRAKGVWRPGVTAFWAAVSEALHLGKPEK
jgi:hypothetical protein